MTQKNKIREIANRTLSITLPIILWGTILGSCSYGLYRERVSAHKTHAAITQVYKAAAGNDRVMDTKEKSQLLKELGINKVIDETESIYLNNFAGNSVEVYATKGYRKNRCLSVIDRSVLERYLENRREKTE